MNDDYASTLDLPQAADLLRRTDGPIAVFTHAKPDGDALGCVIALTAALRAMGKQVAARFVPPVPASLQSLPGVELATVCDARPDAEPGGASPCRGLPDPPALVVVLDTGAKAQVGLLYGYVEKHLDRTLIIDHHLSGDIPARHRFIDPTAAATAEPLADLLDLLPPLPPGGGRGEGASSRFTDPVIPPNLYTALASDTGWFRFSSTSPRTFRLAARLLEAGVDHADLFRRLEQTERPAKVRLLTRALDSLELLADDRAALMVLRTADFIETGAREDETDRIIDMPQMIGSVEVVALVTEREGGAVTAVSFRGKPGESAVNVADLAARFGGGGHARAAGAKIKAPLDEALPRIRDALAAAARAGHA